MIKDRRNMLSQNSETQHTIVMVEFRILGDEFNPDNITQLLSIAPSDSWMKGDAIENRKVVRQYCCWILSTGYVVSLDVAEQIKKITSVLSLKKKTLHKIKEEFDVSFRLDVVAKIKKSDTFGIFLDSDCIDFAHELGAEYDIDLYT